MPLYPNFENLKLLVDSGVSEFIQDIPKPMYILKKNINDTDDHSKDISEINNLSELESFINNSNVCELKKRSNKTVFADGNPSSKIMLIGEAPGADEDKYGKPFVGKAGQYLDRMLKAINLDRTKVYISNVVPWRPPENRQPTSEEIIQCLPFIQKHIELINPYMLILLGGTSAKALLTTNDGISKLRGRWHQYNSLNLTQSIKTRAIFHPAFLLRSPNFKRKTWEDLLEIQKIIKANEIC